QGKISGLIDRLIEDGFIHRDETSEYRLLSLTAAGRAATLDDLAAYNPAPAPPPMPRQGAAIGRMTPGARLIKEGAPDAAEVDEGAWTAEQRALFARLRAWRTEQAQERAVPAYIIAHDRMLQELVARRPASREELLAVKGFGPAKVETYGDDLLALLGDNGD
ncbi:MAG TPA: HRDC domain-containing protein, partial [Vicinamibacteria bacterium]